MRRKEQRSMLALAIVMAFVVGVFWAGPVEAGDPCAGLQRAADILGCELGCGAPAAVEKTGQTDSFVAGDDGNLTMGVAWPDPRFTDNENGTVTDNLTGLIWLKDANCAGTRKIWTEALDFCNGLCDGCTNCGGVNGDCNLSDDSVAGDWRLPNVKELQSLIDYGTHNPALPSGHPFTGVESYRYWSSTTNAYHPGDAWGVYLNYGHVNFDGKGYHYYVWPVRGGE